MDIQLPSFRLQQYLGSPGAGETIPELVEAISPVVDIVPYIYPKTFWNALLTDNTAFTVQRQNGAGIYRIEGRCGGSILNGANAGLLRLQTSPVFSDNSTYIQQRMLAATAYVFQPYSFDTLIDLSNNADITFAVQLTSLPAAVTSVDVFMSFSLQRVI